MPEFNNTFEAALPRVIKWSVGENRFAQDELNDDGNPKFPRSLSLFIPTESIVALSNHLMDLADRKQVPGKIWDYTNNEEIEVHGVYLNAKGKQGEYGDFGSLNPVALGGASAAPPAPARPAAPVPAAAAPARRRF